MRVESMIPRISVRKYKNQFVVIPGIGFVFRGEHCKFSFNIVWGHYGVSIRFFRKKDDKFDDDE